MNKRIRPVVLLAELAFFCVFLVACNTIPDFTKDQGTDVLDKVRSIDLQPRSPSQVQPAELSTGQRPKAMIYPADPVSADAETPSSRLAARSGASGGDTFELNFDNVAIASVAKAILGDILGVGYSVDSRVQGTVSLSSARPVPKADVAFALENALRTAGVALVRDNAAYRLVPQAEAVGAGPADDAESTEPGYGVSIVPLQYASPQMLLKLVENFGTKAGMLRADTARNLILVQGTGIERRNAVDLLLSFDVDWMRGQTVGIFPLQNTNPEPIIAELEKIMGSGEGGVAQGAVRYQPISRMNAILAVTRKPEMLKRVETWIGRLDNTINARSSIHIYYVKFGEAKQIAKAVNEIFGSSSNSGSQGNLDDAGLTAPGSGSSSSSSGSALGRLSLGSNGQSTSAGSSLGSRPATGMAGDSSSSGGSSSSGSGGTLSGFGSTSGTDQQGGSDNAGGSGSTRGGPNGVGGVLEGVRITADSVNNSLLVYASQEQYSIIERAVRQLDRPQRQVAIEATIAEISLTDDLQFGVQSYITSHGLGLKPDIGSAGNSTASSVVGAAGNVVLNRAIPGFNFLVGSGNTPNAILSALHAITNVKVLSNPSLVVIDNQVATLQVGDEIPIQTGTATVLSGNNTVASTQDYKSTGIILRVVPRINANGNVRLDIEQEISNAVANTTAGSSSSTAAGSAPVNPTISTRKLRSSVAVASGQTVLLAGLISETTTLNRSGIPGLDQLPGGVGDLFATKDNNVQRTELIIFIRPQIIRDGADAHFVAEEVRSKLRGSIGTLDSRQLDSTKLR